MKTKVEIRKEVSRLRDEDNLIVAVTVTAAGYKIEGYATLILSANTYHLDSEIEREIELIGIDHDDIRDALEISKYTIEVETMFPIMSLRDRLDTFVKTAIELKLYTIAARLCMAIDTANRVNCNSPEDFGGEWATIECDIEAVEEAVDRANQEDYAARESFEGELLAQKYDGCLY